MIAYPLPQPLTTPLRRQPGSLLTQKSRYFKPYKISAELPDERECDLVNSFEFSDA